MADEKQTGRLQEIFEHMFGYMGLLDPRGRVVRANRAVVDATGSEERDYVGRLMWETPIWSRFVDSSLDPGEAVRRAASGEIVTFEAVFQGRDGTPHTLDLSIKPFMDETGHVLYLIPEGRDVTERHLAEKRLRELEQLYRTIFETTGTATLIVEDDLTVSLANEEFCRMSGYTRQEVEGKMKVSAFISPDHLPRIQKYHEMRMRDPESVPASYDLQVRDRQGRMRDGVITIGMIPGTRLRVLSFMDLTERRRAEAQMYRSEKMAALGQIVAGVAHEINNPNNFVYFNLPLLKRYMEGIRPIVDRARQSDPDLRIEQMTADEIFDDMGSMIDDMLHGCERITEIVGQLKTHVTAEKQEKKNEDPVTLVQRVVKLVGKQVRKKVRRLDVQIPESLPCVEMNAGRMEQVLINLLINASQAADKQDSFVMILATARERDVLIQVQDNGSGIDEQTQSKIFEPFFTTKDPDEGTGLGLWICQGIVEDHGGVMDVESTPGRGTTFTITLPRT